MMAVVISVSSLSVQLVAIVCGLQTMIKILIVAICIIIGSVILLMYNEVTVVIPRQEAWANSCIQKGGQPSKYHVHYKYRTEYEYLCIKPDAIIKVE
jgi:hypothetical protein